MSNQKWLLSEKLFVVTISLFVAMGVGGISLNIVTGSTSDAAIWITSLAVPSVTIGGYAALLQEKNR